jgi:hypothetical protein
MKSVIGHVARQISCLNDASKLSFSAAAGFALVSGAAWLTSYLASSESRLCGLIWIAVFYLALGCVEQMKASRSVPSHPVADEETCHLSTAMTDATPRTRVAA